MGTRMVTGYAISVRAPLPASAEKSRLRAAQVQCRDGSQQDDKTPHHPGTLRSLGALTEADLVSWLKTDLGHQWPPRLVGRSSSGTCQACIAPARLAKSCRARFPRLRHNPNVYARSNRRHRREAPPKVSIVLASLLSKQIWDQLRYRPIFVMAQYRRDAATHVRWQ
jgi:hypothetical protein